MRLREAVKSLQIAGFLRSRAGSGTFVSERAPTLPARRVEPVRARLDERAEVERDSLTRALEAHRWNRLDTARALGMSRSTLWRRMRALGLE